MNRRYVVSAGERLTVTAVLARLGEDGDAVAEGRVFVGKSRVTTNQATRPLRPGDEVRVASRTTTAREAEPVDVLYEDDDVVCVAKPIGLPTVPALQGAEHSLLARVAVACSVAPGSLVTTSRLDRDVSGVVTFAKSSAAAERIAAARASGQLARRYVALSTKAPQVRAGVWDAPIGRHVKPLLRAIRARDAKPAASRFAVIAESVSGVAMMALAPETGRTHQLRLHASDAGAPLLGDRDYGGPHRLTLPTGRVLSIPRIALHCARVRVPIRAGRATAPFREVSAPIPADLRAIWEALGGEPDAWDLALACDV